MGVVALIFESTYLYCEECFLIKSEIAIACQEFCDFSRDIFLKFNLCINLRAKVVGICCCYVKYYIIYGCDYPHSRASPKGYRCAYGCSLRIATQGEVNLKVVHRSKYFVSNLFSVREQPEKYLN